MTELTSSEQLDEVFRLPLAVLFKHSPRCPISRTARAEVERFIREAPKVPVYWVDVIQHSPVSRLIAERAAIRHESPQVIVLREGAVVWHASHSGVTRAALRDHLTA